MRTNTVLRLGAVIVALILIATVYLTVPAVRSAVTGWVGDAQTTAVPAVTPTAGQKTIRYFNDEVSGTDFGPSRKAQAENAGVNLICPWIASSDGTGDFYYSISVDPALCAAVAVHMDEVLRLPVKILNDEQAYPIEMRADQAHLHFLRDSAYWDAVVTQIKSYLTTATVSIAKIKNNTPTMVMQHNGLEGNKPSVIAGNVNNAGDRVVKFALREGTVYFDIERGYEPTSVSYWTVPVEPEEEEQPVVTPTPEPVVTPEPAQHATRTVIGQIHFVIDGEWVTLDMLNYAGGYFKVDDPKLSGLPMENDVSYGVSLVRDTRVDTIAAWLYYLPSSPEQIVRLLVQSGQLQLSPLKSESDYAYELEIGPADTYDEMANLALSYVYEWLDGGSAPFDTDWQLENMLKVNKKGRKTLIGRKHGDDDKAPNKDVLFTLLDKNGRPILAAPLGLENTARAANANPRDYDVNPYINATEGGTYKWRRGEDVVITTPPPTNTPTPPPTDPPPTNTPTAPPTDPPPTETPTAPPTDPPPTETPTAPPTDPPPTNTPTLEPKPTGAGPQGQTDDDDEGTEDFGGGQNHDNDETLDEEEPQAPETYNPPAPPSNPPTDKPTATPTAKPTAKPSEKPSDKPSDKPSPSPTPELVQGEDPGDLAQIQEEEHSEDTVDPALQGDGENQGDPNPDEVE